MIIPLILLFFLLFFNPLRNPFRLARNANEIIHLRNILIFSPKLPLRAKGQNFSRSIAKSEWMGKFLAEIKIHQRTIKLIETKGISGARELGDGKFDLAVFGAGLGINFLKRKKKNETKNFSENSIASNLLRFDVYCINRNRLENSFGKCLGLVGPVKMLA